MATVTTNMSLKSWNLANDPFVRQDLVDNWTAIDLHDHTTGKGVQVPTAGIKDGAVTAAKVAAGTLDGSKIALASIADANLVSPNNATYKSVSHAAGVYDGTSGNLALGADAFYLSTANMARLVAFPIVGTDYAVSGLNTRYRLRLTYGVASTSGTGTVNFCIWPITGTAATTLFTANLGTAVAGSILTLTNPVANATATLVTSDFTLSDGTYCFGLSSSSLTPSGTVGVYASYRLQVHNI